MGIPAAEVAAYANLSYALESLHPLVLGRLSAALRASLFSALKQYFLKCGVGRPVPLEPRGKEDSPTVRERQALLSQRCQNQRGSVWSLSNYKTLELCLLFEQSSFSKQQAQNFLLKQHLVQIK